MSHFVIRWLETGRAVFSKNTPHDVRELVHAGLLDQAPRKAEEMASKGKTAKPKKSNNPFNVRKSQVWESTDLRTLVDGKPRRVMVVSVDSTHAVVERIADTSRKSRTKVRLTAFDGKSKGYKLVSPMLTDKPQETAQA